MALSCVVFLDAWHRFFLLDRTIEADETHSVNRLPSPHPPERRLDMRIVMRTHGIPRSPELSGHVERRLRFVLARFDERLERVTVLLSDQNAERGGIDKLCAIAVRSHGGAEVRIEREASDLRTAIDLACERVKQTLTRSFARLTDLRRGRIRR
jgi:ribosome-associated translation inhibitor RaiA